MFHVIQYQIVKKGTPGAEQQRLLKVTGVGRWNMRRPLWNKSPIAHRVAPTPLRVGLTSLLTAPRFQLHSCVDSEWLHPQPGGGQPQDQSSPGTLCIVMARMSRAILLQLLTVGCPEFPCTGPEGAAPSGRPAAATFFLWYTSPFSLLSVQKEEWRDRGCINVRTDPRASRSKEASKPGTILHLDCLGPSIS